MAQFDGHSIKFERADMLINIGSLKDLNELTRNLPTY